MRRSPPMYNKPRKIGFFTRLWRLLVRAASKIKFAILNNLVKPSDRKIKHVWNNHIKPPIKHVYEEYREFRSPTRKKVVYTRREKVVLVLSHTYDLIRTFGYWTMIGIIVGIFFWSGVVFMKVWIVAFIRLNS